jgi:hypothetical protein
MPIGPETVFLSYARPDLERVLPFYENLTASGYKRLMRRQ